MSPDRKRIEELRDRAALEREQLAGALRDARAATRRWQRGLAAVFSRASLLGGILGGAVGVWKTKRLLSRPLKEGSSFLARLFAGALRLFRRN